MGANPSKEGNTMGFATNVRRQYRRGLMTRLEMQLELGMITTDEVLREGHRLRVTRRR